MREEGWYWVIRRRADGAAEEWEPAYWNVVKETWDSANWFNYPQKAIAVVGREIEHEET